jgi:RNA polymerase sigma-70 factor (ECF subfamily)
MKFSQAELVHELLARNEQALSEFWQAYAPKVRRYVASHVADTTDAEEVVQITFIAFFDALRDFTGSSSLSTYIFGICRHKITDYYRKKHLKEYLFSRIPGLEDLIGTNVDPADHTEQVFLREKIRHVFQAILPRHAQILRAKYVEGRTIDEIAKETSVSVKTAESLLFRARQSFMNMFGE